MKWSRTLLILAALFIGSLPVTAQGNSSTPATCPAAAMDHQVLAPALPSLGTPPTVPAIGGTRECSAFKDDGSPNPDWPECNESDPISGPSCDGLSSCYCVCRYNHRCDLDPAECDPLSQCLTNCDAQYPSCPYPGGDYPDSIADCL